MPSDFGADELERFLQRGQAAQKAINDLGAGGGQAGSSQFGSTEPRPVDAPGPQTATEGGDEGNSACTSHNDEPPPSAADLACEEELWLPIPSAPGYSASNQGRIWSRSRTVQRVNGWQTVPDRILKPTPNEKGYGRVSVPHERDRAFVHRLVAEAWIGPLPDGKEVNHKDGNPRNNRVDNLEYVTRSEQRIHAMNMGRHDIRGERGLCSKLTSSDVLNMRDLFRAGIKQADLARNFGVSYGTVFDVVRRRTWKHLP